MVNKKDILIDRYRLDNKRIEKNIYKKLLKITKDENISITEIESKSKLEGIYTSANGNKNISLNTNLRRNSKEKSFLLAFYLGVSKLEEERADMEESLAVLLVYSEGHTGKDSKKAKLYAENLIDELSETI